MLLVPHELSLHAGRGHQIGVISSAYLLVWYLQYYTFQLLSTATYTAGLENVKH